VALPSAAAPPPAATAPPAAASPPAGASTALAAPVPAPARRPVLRLPDPHANALFARGQAAEEQGDISGARRFYAAAAERGHAAAARDLGRMYDPAVLEHVAVGGIDANPALARQWYLRATELGDQDAKPLLQALTTR
jgi:TPR repeat protein